MASISKSRRVSIGGPRPLLSKSNSAASALTVTKDIKTPSSLHKKPSSVTTKVASISPEIATLRREKEALEEQLALQRRATTDSEGKKDQLTAHINVLEDLLEKKKDQLDYIESKLEALGLDPIVVTPFEQDESEERSEYLEEEEREFEGRMQFLREGLEARNRALEDSLTALATINRELDDLENGTNENESPV